MSKRQSKAEVYRDAAGEWRWRLVAGNGRTVADSAEGYKTRAGALKGLDVVRSAAASGIVEVRP